MLKISAETLYGARVYTIEVPTQQLASQVLESALGEGIEAEVDNRPRGHLVQFAATDAELGAILGAALRARSAKSKGGAL